MGGIPNGPGIKQHNEIRPCGWLILAVQILYVLCERRQARVRAEPKYHAVGGNRFQLTSRGLLITACNRSLLQPLARGDLLVSVLNLLLVESALDLDDCRDHVQRQHQHLLGVAVDGTYQSVVDDDIRLRAQGVRRVDDDSGSCTEALR